MKVLIVEDEKMALRRLIKMVKEVNPNIQIVGHTDGIESTLAWLKANHKPDLIFLDIHLSDGNCFEIFKHATIEKPVIFTTAYDEYAIQSFELNTIDYLLKPIKKAELVKALVKVQKRATINYNRLAKALKNENDANRILVRIGTQLKLVDLNTAAYIFTKDKLTNLITQEGHRHTVDQSLEKLEEYLDTRSFFRINRQYIINIEAIKKMSMASKSRVRLELDPPCNELLIVSTERSPKFKKWLVGAK